MVRPSQQAGFTFSSDCLHDAGLKATVQLPIRMTRRWSIVRRGDRKFFAMSDAGRLVANLTRGGLEAFLSSRGVRDTAIRALLQHLEAEEKSRLVRVDLEE